MSPKKPPPGPKPSAPVNDPPTERLLSDRPTNPGALAPPRIEPKGLVQIAVALPKATLHMLETEAGTYGWRRSQFLDALIMHKLGMGLRLERIAPAPTYTFTKADWTTTERWLWYIRPDLKPGFDELRMRSGNIPARAWIILAMNEWVGLPTGFANAPT